MQLRVRLLKLNSFHLIIFILFFLRNSQENVRSEKLLKCSDGFYGCNEIFYEVFRDKDGFWRMEMSILMVFFLRIFSAFHTNFINVAVNVARGDELNMD